MRCGWTGRETQYYEGEKKHSLCKNQQTYGDVVDAEICAADDEDERHLVAAWPTNGSCAGSACRGEEDLNGLGAANRKKKKRDKNEPTHVFFFFYIGKQVGDDFLEAAAKPRFHVRPTRPKSTRG